MLVECFEHVSMLKDLHSLKSTPASRRMLILGNEQQETQARQLKKESSKSGSSGASTELIHIL
jgi:hypothetical protein